MVFESVIRPVEDRQDRFVIVHFGYENKKLRRCVQVSRRFQYFVILKITNSDAGKPLDELIDVSMMFPVS